MNINEIIEGTDVVVKVNRVETTAVFCGVSTRYHGYANVEVDGVKMVRKIIRVGTAQPFPSASKKVTRNVAGHEVQVEAPAAPEVAADADGEHAYDTDTSHHIKEMTKSVIRHQLRPAIADALAEVERKFGVKVRLGNASYDSTSVRFKNVEVVIGSDAQEVERNNFMRNAVHRWSESLNRAITANDYGKRFTCRGRTYIFTGCNPKSPKYQWSGRDAVSNKSFKFTDSTIRDLH